MALMYICNLLYNLHLFSVVSLARKSYLLNVLSNLSFLTYCDVNVIDYYDSEAKRDTGNAIGREKGYPELVNVLQPRTRGFVTCLSQSRCSLDAGGCSYESILRMHSSCKYCKIIRKIVT